MPNPRPALDVDECIPFTYGQIHQFAAMMKLHEIKPELELYHPGCAWGVQYLIENDLVQEALLDSDGHGLSNRKPTRR